MKYKPYKFLADKLKNKFLNNLVRFGTIDRAAAETGIARQTHYDWKKASDEYCMKYEEAMHMRADTLEDAAYIRAVEGIEVTDYYKGQKIGTHREYSDSLLQTLLKAAMPEKYRERTQTEVTGETGAVLTWEGDENG